MVISFPGSWIVWYCCLDRALSEHAMAAQGDSPGHCTLSGIK